MSHCFRRLHPIDTDSFLSDLKSSQFITNPPDSLDCLLTAYNSTLSSLLDKHAPLITKLPNRKPKSNPWFSHTLRAFRTTLLHAKSIYKHTHSALDWSKFISPKSLPSSHPWCQNNIFPNWLLCHLIILGVCSKLLINSWTTNLLHHNLPHLQPLRLLIALLTSSPTIYPSSH